MTETSVQPFEAEVSQVLRLVVGSLYSHPEIFLRELVSNASDALDKLRFRSIREPELLEAGEELRIRLLPDAESGTLTIWDNGVGMTREELASNLGTIARSGTRDFARKLEEAQKAASAGLSLIGQFGVGFYSAYLVADRVDVLSRAAGTEEAHRWSSDARETFTIEPADRDRAGTSVTLHLKAEHRELLEAWRLRELVGRYSDYVGYPIELAVKKESDEATDEAGAFDRINQASALWRRAPREITAEQYEEFYKHLTRDWEAPLSHRHFRIEGTQEFVGLLFLPGRAPFDLFDPSRSHGIRLHVKRVFVMDDCEEILPRWLRFVRGVVDSEDLPLNVSRELLQDSRVVKTIRKQVIQQCLQMLEELAANRPDDYQRFWKSFGAVLKEGLHFEPEYGERLAELLRFESSGADGLVSLDDYVKRMKEGQKAIFYAAGTSRGLLETSPHLEEIRRRGFEVLYMTDPIDPFALERLPTYREKPLVSAMTENLSLEGDEPAPADSGAAEEAAGASGVSAAFLHHARTVLAEHVSEVRVSKRLTDSPACLVVPEGGLAPHVERWLRAQRADVPVSKRVLEVNPSHPVMASLQKRYTESGASDQLDAWIRLVHDQALIAEGSPVDDPARFARQVAELLAQAASGAAEKR